jgi:hypothetical protein
MKVRALRTLHRPSPTWAPTITDVAGLSVATGDRSIVAVHPGETVDIEEREARRLIARRFVEAIK